MIMAVTYNQRRLLWTGSQTIQRRMSTDPNQQSRECLLFHELVVCFRMGVFHIHMLRSYMLLLRSLCDSIIEKAFVYMIINPLNGNSMTVVASWLEFSNKVS